MTVTTVINYTFFNTLGNTGVTMLYLIVVVAVAYFCTFAIASGTAIAGFLAINYFFVAPRYTFEVAHIESWASLISFLIVSLVITSLVKQLKSQTEVAMLSSKRAEFAKALAEKLAFSNDLTSLISDTCELLATEFNKPFAIAQLDVNNIYQLDSDHLAMPDQKALKWTASNGKSIGPYTDNWPESVYWIMPFNRLPSQLPILVVGNVSAEDSVETYTAIKSCVDQISQAYQRLINNEKVKHAELIAQEEAIQSALLASISHDMRTPLTSILGAATTLQQADLEPAQATHLTSLIASQARYLATTTENILSLIRLESSEVKQIPMDWQSPEELIGVVTALYKNRGESLNLKVTASDPELLIKGNANLLMQALVNLIDNANQAQTDLSNLNPEPILIDVLKTDNRINISVNDRGKGFDETFTASQIKKFSSTNAKGFGLGLSIVQAIAKLHDARLFIHNREGGGACVTLSFNIPNTENANA
ncbi:MAG TPA: DUF4118 domain-containing protein [Methylotenera sp.]|nr:DUF4118 domain-containing protein [Methylotenera sp.]